MGATHSLVFKTMSSLTDIGKNFYAAIDRTFIVDDRYQTFLEGIKNTLTITAGALVVGVIIGVAMAIAKVYYYQSGSFTYKDCIRNFSKTKRPLYIGRIFQKLLDQLISAYLVFFRGTPVVVQLMIWAFVVFSTTNEIIVAILGFGINSGAYVAEIVRAGIMAVDNGQTEAGRSLGLSAWQTMWHIILPQAFKNMLPALGNELIALLKETSIVGYIAVVDLTKAAALVRARTFDAFVPLLFVALAYLIMVFLLSVTQHFIERKLQASDGR